MCLKITFFLTALVIISTSVFGQDNSEALDIINRSINFHDPKGILLNQNVTMHFEEKRPDGSIRNSYFKYSVPQENFELERGSKERRIKYKIEKSDTSIFLNNKELTSEAQLEAEKLSKERAIRLKDYYLYLWALPMKLRDSGTIVSSRVNTTQFNGEVCYEVRVTYSENIGKDIWYFYFKTDNYQMMAYRFYHDENANDGEYIFLNDLLEENGLKIPKSRKWYTHKEDKYLGEDVIVKLEQN